MEGTRLAEILSEHRECYASCNRSHPHCANYIHGSQDVWPCETLELATLAAQAERYREALETAREALNWRDNEIRLGIRDPLGEEEIRAVGERFGYGVLMSTASRLWYEKAGSGAFAVGHCVAIVEKADRVAAAALEEGGRE